MHWFFRFLNSPSALPASYRSCLSLILLSIGYSHQATAQHLEAAGLSGSLNVTQTPARPAFVNMGSYVLDMHGDNSRYDEIGYRLAAYARWQLGASRFFGQPELAYTDTRSQAYPVLYDLTNPQFGPSFFTFSHTIRRWEAAGLLGLHTGRQAYVRTGRTSLGF